MLQLPFAQFLRATPWRELAGWGLASAFMASLVKMLAPDALQPSLRSAGLALPLLLLAAKDLAHAP
ncbi:hypothetical protein FPK48_33905, partial [Acinetobacter baumannii]|nr:hypothetical protein [Acinetobacter baumannii]